MGTQIKDHGAHSSGQPHPDIALQQKAISSTKTHALYYEAQAFAYCEPVVQIEPKEFIEKLKIGEEEKTRMLESLAAVKSVVIVSFFTAEKQPEPLAGFGKTYGFILHPESMDILYSDTGTWRS